MSSTDETMDAARRRAHELLFGFSSTGPRGETHACAAHVTFSAAICDRLTAALAVSDAALVEARRERDEARARLKEKRPGSQPPGMTVREAARRRFSLDGADTQALEGAIALTERERDEANERARAAEHNYDVLKADSIARIARVRADGEQAGRAAALLDAKLVVARLPLVAIAIRETEVRGDKVSSYVNHLAALDGIRALEAAPTERAAPGGAALCGGCDQSEGYCAENCPQRPREAPAPADAPVAAPVPVVTPGPVERLEYGEIALAMAQSALCEAARLAGLAGSKSMGERFNLYPEVVEARLSGAGAFDMRDFGYMLAACGFEPRFSLVAIPAPAPPVTAEPAPGVPLCGVMFSWRPCCDQKRRTHTDRCDLSAGHPGAVHGKIHHHADVGPRAPNNNFSPPIASNATESHAKATRAVAAEPAAPPDAREPGACDGIFRLTPETLIRCERREPGHRYHFGHLDDDERVWTVDGETPDHRNPAATAPLVGLLGRAAKLLRNAEPPAYVAGSLYANKWVMDRDALLADYARTVTPAAKEEA